MEDDSAEAQNNQQPPRQTILGNFILQIMNTLKEVKAQYNINQPLIFKILQRFTSLGAHARRFLLRAGGLECLLSYFYDGASPVCEKWEHHDFV